MSSAEARNIQTGKISITFAVIEDELFLLGKLGQLEWFDTPYEPARFELPQIYSGLESGKGAPVIVIGADSTTGIVRALRPFGMSNIMSNALHEVCRDMDVRHRPLDIKKQNAHIQEIYQKFPNSASMLRCANPNYVTVIV